MSWHTNASIVQGDSNLFNISTSANRGDSIASSAIKVNYRIVNFNTSNVVPTADENRPLNYSVNICIIYE